MVVRRNPYAAQRLKAQLERAQRRAPWILGDELDLDLRRGQAERAVEDCLEGRARLTAEGIFQLEILERLFRRWDRAQSSERQASALHRAAVDVDPGVTAIWVPLHRRPSTQCSRAYFSRGLRLVSRARERGELRQEFTAHSGLLAAEAEADWPRLGKGPGISQPERRCEGRSRAPQKGSAGANASRGGGGDDSGGGGGSGGDSAGGDGSGSEHPRRRINWIAVGAIAALIAALTAVGAFVHGLVDSPPPVAPQPIIIEPAPPSTHRLDPPQHPDSSGYFPDRTAGNCRAEDRFGVRVRPEQDSNLRPIP